MTPEQVLQKFPYLKVPDGMELIEWGHKDCPIGCVLVAFRNVDKKLMPLVTRRHILCEYDHIFLITPIT